MAEHGRGAETPTSQTETAGPETVLAIPGGRRGLPGLASGVADPARTLRVYVRLFPSLFNPASPVSIGGVVVGEAEPGQIPPLVDG